MFDTFERSHNQRLPMTPEVQKYIDSQFLKLKAELMVQMLSAPGSVIASHERKFIIPALHEALAKGDYENIINGSIRQNTHCFVKTEVIKRGSI